MHAGAPDQSLAASRSEASLRVEVEVLSYANRFIGGDGNGSIVLPFAVPRGTTIAALLRRVTEAHPALAEALWEDRRCEQLGSHLEVMVNDVVLGVQHELTSVLESGDRVLLMPQFVGG